MYSTQNTSRTFRKARTRTLIQLGGLIEKTGLLEILGITPGADLQKDIDMQIPAATLMGALSELARDLKGDVYHLETLAQRGKQALASEKTENPS